MTSYTSRYDHETELALARLSAAYREATTEAAKRRDGLYNAVRFACHEGLSVAAIARRSGLDRVTVRRLRDTPTEP